jgi:2-phosphosulfolactate phosphatase
MPLARYGEAVNVQPGSEASTDSTLAADLSGQSRYQVRFDLALPGAQRITAGADVVVLVDALGETTSIVVAAEQGRDTGPRPDDSAAGARLAAELAAEDVVVLAAALRNRSAIARRVLDLQSRRGRRMIVAIVAVGERWPDGRARFALEDQLVAGAVVDALSDIGIDDTSPEAAVASAAFAGLEHAVKHVLSACVSAKALAAQGRHDEVALAAQLDVTDVVPEFRERTFRAR